MTRMVEGKVRVLVVIQDSSKGTSTAALRLRTVFGLPTCACIAGHYQAAAYGWQLTCSFCLGA
jgi:hypothetical protein